MVAPSEAFTKGLSKALAKVYPYELEHIVSYFDAGMKLGQMLNNRNQTLSNLRFAINVAQTLNNLRFAINVALRYAVKLQFYSKSVM